MLFRLNHHWCRISLLVVVVVVLLGLIIFRGGNTSFLRQSEHFRTKNGATKNTTIADTHHSPSNLVDHAKTVRTNNDDGFDWKAHVRFFVLGVQKGGTTSLYKYMGQHPQIQASFQKETRCFQVDYKPSDPYCARYFANPRFRQRHPDYITGDFSPGYIWRTESVIPRINSTYPQARFIVTLRHPVERAFSQFRMHKRNKKLDTNATFESLCLEELESLRHAGLLPYWQFPPTMDEAQATSNDNLQALQYMYAQAVVNQTAFDSFFGSTAMQEAWQRLLTSPVTASRGMVQKGLYAIQLHQWMHAFPRQRFLVVSLEETSFDTQAVMQRIHEHLGLAYIPIEDVSPLNTGGDLPSQPAISFTMQRILSKLYQPYDNILSFVLADPSWTIPWNLDSLGEAG